MHQIIVWKEKVIYVGNKGKLGSPLGDINPGTVPAVLECSNNLLTLKGAQSSDAVDVNFDVTLNNDNQYTAKGSLKPGDGLPSALKRQIGFLGQADDEGKFNFSESGRL